VARVLLIGPPSPERLGAPLLGLQHVAAALLARGCEVRVIDAAARYFDHDHDWVVAEADHYAPDMIGFGLFTRWVWHAYRLAGGLGGSGALLVAGGAHTTVRPDEAIQSGFDVAVVGEAERTIVELVDHLEGRKGLEDIPGIRFRASDGSIRGRPHAPPLSDLDALPLPMTAQHLFEPRWYHPSGVEIIPGGVLTSRGCPARCTFCANYVTGRGFRFRSSESVVHELNLYHERFGASFFPFWDDALTAHRPRLVELCEAMRRDIRFPLRWSAITRANMVTPELLRTMKSAGLAAVNFGVESGDDEILRAIKKGITTDRVVRALEWSKAEGLHTACNFMLGFPQESPAALERTLRFMERIAPMVDSFSTLGVVVPFPGTPIYDENHIRYGFTDWWLKEEYGHYAPSPPVTDFERFYRHYIDDANLDLDFFTYTPELRTLVRACLRFKAEHNLNRMGLLADPVFRFGPTELVDAAIEVGAGPAQAGRARAEEASA
jgi:anaerobic magnesium-protoporphyrin IX monomethyl ester cyclase